MAYLHRISYSTILGAQNQFIYIYSYIDVFMNVKRHQVTNSNSKEIAHSVHKYAFQFVSMRQKRFLTLTVRVLSSYLPVLDSNQDRCLPTPESRATAPEVFFPHKRVGFETTPDGLIMTTTTKNSV